MKSSAAFILVSLLFGMFCPGRGYALTLVDSGKSAYTIVLSAEPSPTEIHGANELKMFLEMISGASIPIARENEDIAGPMILVGRSAKLGAIDAGIDFEELGDEGFIIKSTGGHLILAGGRLRGSMYAVYTFLEEELGCRWYTSKASRIPRMSTVTVGPINRTQIPAFEYREPYWTDAYDGDWAARNKCNGSAARLDRKRGGKIRGHGGHTFYPYMPPERHYTDHPEWYSITSNRRRQWENAQLCLTNPEVHKVMARQVMTDMARSPENTTFAVGQNDWYGYCECEHCKRVDDYEGSQAGTMVGFANAVAERTEKQFPRNRIIVFAYQYTEKPPRRVRPAGNVIISLCNMHGDGQGCDAHPLERCDLNRKFVESLKSWSPIADKIYVWDYVTNFSHYLAPFPIWRTNKEDLLFFRKYGVDGVFEEGADGGSGRGCSEILAYVEAKLLWDPDRDVDAIVDDFITGYYGPAAAEMKEFHRYLDDRVMKDWHHFTMWSPMTNEMYSPEFLATANDILDRAERAAASRSDRAAASDRDAAFRVEAARLMTEYVKLSKPLPRVMENGFYRPAPGTQARSTIRDLYSFVEKCKKHEVEELSNARGYYQRMRAMTANLGTHRVVTLENPFLEIEVIPGIGGKIYQITDKRAGKRVLRIGSPTEATFPMAGGMREYPNDAEDCSFRLEKTPEGQKVMLESTVFIRGYENAMISRREIFLPADKPEIRFRSSLEALITISVTRISPVLELAFGNAGEISAGFADGSGRFRMEPLMLEKDERGNLNRTLRAGEIASGRLGIANTGAGLALIGEFDRKQVEFCSFAQGTAGDGITFGIRSLPKPLRPGERLEFSYTFVFPDPSTMEIQ